MKELKETTELLEEFCEYLSKEKGSSKNTIESYKLDVEEYMNVTEKEIMTNNKMDVISYIIQLQREKKSTATISRRIASIRNFYSFLLNTGRIQKDPMISISSPKVIRKSPDFLTIEEVAKIIETPKIDTVKGSRDRAIMEMIYSSGLKVNTIINMNITDVNLEYGYVTIYRENNIKKYIPLGKVAIESLKIYLSKRNTLDKLSKKQLFLNIRGEMLTRQYIWKMIREYSSKASIEKKTNPEILRHSFAYHMLENGADIRIVQEILGHSTLIAMEIYKKKENVKMKEELNSKHPRF